MRWLSVSVTLFAACISMSFAQSNPIDGGVQEVVDNTTWNLGSNDLFVGTSTAYNGLTITEDASVSNRNGVIGRQTSSFNNSVNVDKSSSWYNFGDLTVGDGGHDNTLDIAENSYVFSYYDTLVGGVSIASNNTITVRDNSSLGVYEDLTIGHRGSENLLDVRQNSEVYVADTLYLGYEDEASGNQVVFREGGELDADDLVVGEDGVSNRLSVLSGGYVDVEDDVIVGNSEFADNNSILVSGTDGEDASELYIEYDDLYIGYHGSSNSVTVSNGGRIELYGDDDGYVVLGENIGADGNALLITGTNSSLEVDEDVIVGYNGDRNSFTITDYAEADVYGDVIIGDYGSSNRLEVSGGARLYNDYGVIGDEYSASNNYALVTGEDSLWWNDDGLIVGYDGYNSRLDVTNGGLVVVGDPEMDELNFYGADLAGAIVVGDNYNAGHWFEDGFWVGETSVANSRLGYIGSTESDDNAVAGIYGTWNIDKGLYEGGYRDEEGDWHTSSGTNHALLVGYGEGYSPALVNVGRGDTNAMDSLLNENSGDSLTNASMLAIGGTDGAEMIIAGDSVAYSEYGMIGAGTNDVGHVTVMDNYSVSNETDRGWHVWDNLSVGGYGSGNSLIVSNGGFVQAGDIDIGLAASSSNNLIHVTGSNSMLIADYSDLDVGENGSHNQLIIENSGYAYVDEDLEIGDASGADYNQVIVRTGARIDVDNSYEGEGEYGNVYVGKEGSHNSLLVESGGYIDIDSEVPGGENLIIGDATNSMYNTATVRGADSEIYVDNDILVGSSGSYNTLIVESNGYVYADDNLDIGYYDTADSNTVTVSDGGKIETGDDVVVGDEGSHNEMNISDALVDTGGDGYIGMYEGADFNRVFVTNDGLWSMEGDLMLGGRYQEMAPADAPADAPAMPLIEDEWVTGGASNSLYLGTLESSNTYDQAGYVIVGNGSFDGEGPGLYIGDADTAEMVLDNYSTVTSPLAFIGGESNAVAKVTVMNGSVWSNNLTILGGENDLNRMIVTNGGKVYSDATWIGTYFGEGDGQDNLLHVNGSNSFVRSSTLLLAGSNNVVRADAGAEIESTDFLIADSGNLTEVTGEGTLLDVTMEKTGSYVEDEFPLGLYENGRTLVIGYGEGSKLNGLMITDGARVQDYIGVIGSSAGADDNLVALTNAVWQNDEAVYMGGYVGSEGWVSGGSNNTLLASGSNATVLVGHVNTGVLADVMDEMESDSVIAISDSDGDALLMADNDSYLETESLLLGVASNAAGRLELTHSEADVHELVAGVYGSDSRANIIGGSRVDTRDLVLGWFGSAVSNRMVIADTGTVVYAEEALVGMYGDENELWVQDGGTLRVSGFRTMYIGAASNADENVTYVTGTNSTLDVYGQLYIGYEGSSNGLAVANGGYAEAGAITAGATPWSQGNAILVSGSGSELYVGTRSVGDEGGGDEGLLMIGEYGDDNQLLVDKGGYVDADDLVVGAYSDNNRVTITDEDSRMDVRYETWVGYEGRSNLLEVTESGELNISSPDTLYIGVTSNATDNIVSVTDGGRLYAGSIQLGPDGKDNTLSLNDDGYVRVYGSVHAGSGTGTGNLIDVQTNSTLSISDELTVENGSTLVIGPDSTVIAGTYQQDASSTNIFEFKKVDGVLTNGVLRVDGTAEFEAESTVVQEIDSVADMTIDQEYVVIEAQEIVAGGVTNNIDALRIRTLVDAVILTNAAPVDQIENAPAGRIEPDTQMAFVRRSIAEAGNLVGSSASGALDEIDGLSTNGNDEARAMVGYLDGSGMTEDELNGLMDQVYGRRMNVENAINKGRNAAIQQMKVRAQAVRTAQNAPQPYGAAGPHAEDQGWRFWMKGYGTRADQDVPGTGVSQDIDVYGTLVGLDRSYGTLLYGIAGGYASIDMDQTDGTSGDVDSCFGMIYASAGTGEWFADMSLSYAMNDVSYLTGTAALGTEADFDADNFAAYIGGGKELAKGAWRITPEAALTVGYYDQEAYTETARGVGIPASVDSYSQWSYQTSLGGSLAYLKEFDNNVTLRPEIRAYWLHELDAKDQGQNYRLTSGTQQHEFTVHSPDEDVLEIGAGVSTQLGDSLEVRVDVDMQISDNYDGVTASGRIAYEF